MKKSTVILFGFIGFFLLHSVRSVNGDILILKSGRTWEGVSIENGDRFIKFDVGIGVPVTFYKDEVDRLVSKPFNPNKIRSEQKSIKNSIKREEVVKTVKNIEMALQKKDLGSLKNLISDGAKFIFIMENEKVEYSKEEYLQFLHEIFNSTTSMHSFEYTIENIQLQGQQAVSIENIRDLLIPSVGQKLESITRQKSFYQKDKKNTLQLIRSEMID